MLMHIRTKEMLCLPTIITVILIQKWHWYDIMFNKRSKIAKTCLIRDF